MLETIREFGALALTGSGEEERTRREHALYFTELAEESEPHLQGPGQVEWLARLEKEREIVTVLLQRPDLSYEEIGELFGVSEWPIKQIVQKYRMSRRPGPKSKGHYSGDDALAGCSSGSLGCRSLAPICVFGPRRC